MDRFRPTSRWWQWPLAVAVAEGTGLAQRTVDQRRLWRVSTPAAALLAVDESRRLAERCCLDAQPLRRKEPSPEMDHWDGSRPLKK